MTSWASATYVNEERCRESLLCAGDVLTVGTVDLKLRAADPSELISQLPEVSVDPEHLAAIRRVSGDETLRRLDDLDTALGLLNDELSGREESADQLNELIGQIEHDISRRLDGRNLAAASDELPADSRDQAPNDVSPSSEAPSSSVPSAGTPSNEASSDEAPSDELAVVESARPVSNDWFAVEPAGQTSVSQSLDDLLGAVVPDATAARQTDAQLDTQNADDVDAEFANEESVSDADEFAQLVGSTSVLGQNLTLNALRSRAEAVRQLDELVLAASGSSELSGDETFSERRSATAPQSPTASGGFAAGPDDAGFDSELPEARQDEMTDEWVADEWRAEPVDQEIDADDEEPTAVVPSDDSAETDVESQDELASGDTVEYSAMDTVNEAGSLLSSLFREEPSVDTTASEKRSEIVETTPATGEPSVADKSPTGSAADGDVEELETQSSHAADAESWGGASADDEQSPAEAPPEVSFDADPAVADAAAAAPAAADAASDAVAEDVSGVRSRLAEMFDMPALISAQPPGSATDDDSTVRADASDAWSQDTESGDGQLVAERTPEAPASLTPSLQLTTWLDGVKYSGSPSGREDLAADDERAAADGSRFSVGSDGPQESAEPAVKSADSSASPAPATAASPERDAEVDPEDSVAAYMKDLLARNRARTGQPERPEDFVVPSSRSEEEVATEDTADEDGRAIEEEASAPSDADVQNEADAEPQSWLAQQPRHQLDKDRMRAETQTLREVANATARSAVSKATRRQLKIQVAVKTTASVLMLGCGVAASMLGISTGFALLAVGVGVYFAYDLAMTIARNWKAIHA